MTIKFEPNNFDGETLPGDTHRQKANWHRARAGKLRNATIKSVGKHTYAAEMLDRGVGRHHPDHPEHNDGEFTDHDYAFNPN